MSDAETQSLPRLYGDLAWIWPAWSRPDGDYFDYARHVLMALTRAGAPAGGSLLVFACGGGTNIANLKRSFHVTGCDLSPQMLALARTLNPECTFVEGDMRRVALGREFDAVFIDDGISYMRCRADLLQVFQNAFRHLRAGGVMAVTADVCKEDFEQNHTTVWPAFKTSGPDSAEITIVENQYDADPCDDTFETLMLFLIRQGGALRVEQDVHVLGLFPVATWRDAVSGAGFSVRTEPYEEAGHAYTTFVATKPR